MLILIISALRFSPLDELSTCGRQLAIEPPNCTTRCFMVSVGCFSLQKQIFQKSGFGVDTVCPGLMCLVHALLDAITVAFNIDKPSGENFRLCALVGELARAFALSRPMGLFIVIPRKSLSLALYV